MYLGSSVIRCVGVTDPTTLETLACREALALALDLSLTHVEIASDCKNAVQDINLGTGGMNASIVKEIRQSITLFHSCAFIFEGRAANREAHSLAKFSLFLARGRHLWLTEPHDQSCIPLFVEFAE